MAKREETRWIPCDSFDEGDSARIFHIGVNVTKVAIRRKPVNHLMDTYIVSISVAGRFTVLSRKIVIRFVAVVVHWHNG